MMYKSVYRRLVYVLLLAAVFALLIGVPAAPQVYAADCVPTEATHC